jgi:thiol reductant ABC exporter CydD subunit
MFRQLFQQVTSARKLLVVSVGLGLAGGVLIIVQAIYMARITEQAFLHGKGWAFLQPIFIMLLIWIGLRAIIHAVGEATATQMASSIKNDLRKRLIRHLAYLGPQYTKGERSGEIVGTLYEGIEHLEIYLARYLPQIALSALIPLTVMGVVGGLDRMTFAILAVTAPLIIFFMILIGVTAKAKTELQWKKLGILGAHFLDVLRGMTTLKIFNRSNAQMDVIRRISDDYRKTTMGTLRIAFLSAFVMELLTTLSTAVVAVLLGIRLLSGELDFHRSFLILLLVPEFYLPIRMLGSQFHAGQNGTAAAKRIFEILQTEPQGLVEREEAITLPIQPCGYRIEFEQVSFTYPHATEAALSQLSFVIHPGENIAIVGPSGAGKSTVFELLLGFIRPAEGRILIEGMDLNKLSPAWWRAQMGWVAQHAHLFHGTILENLRMAKPEAAREAVNLALKLAKADQFIAALPAGIDTAINETIRLSGGQIQRLSIARAILTDAPLLLLDEPAAQLDVESEQEIQEVLENLLANKTAIRIVHRLGMVQGADKILVMEHGCVVEQGKHHELIGNDGLYSKLVKAYDRTRMASSVSMDRMEVQVG